MQNGTCVRNRRQPVTCGPMALPPAGEEGLLLSATAWMRLSWSGEQLWEAWGTSLEHWTTEEELEGEEVAEVLVGLEEEEVVEEEEIEERAWRF